MNERIQQLAEQCTSWSEGSTWTSHEEFDKEKFAELIVRECAKIASGTQVDEPPNDLFYGYNLGVNKAAENIKQHFGVDK